LFIIGFMTQSLTYSTEKTQKEAFLVYLKMSRFSDDFVEAQRRSRSQRDIPIFFQQTFIFVFPLYTKKKFLCATIF
ncbi:MAG TPA: hypothetical protein VLB50_09180, partial [Ignavibacteriaceae bacterium]|nr:hypothetical protein [Ignavibacteriaceae bacterium]